MTFTKWQDAWGPSLWGGICLYDFPDTDQIAGPKGPLITSALYLAQDEPSAPVPANDKPYGVLGADSIGWAPRNTDPFDESGNLTCVVTTKTDASVERHELYFVRGDWAGRTLLVTKPPDPGGAAVHSELFGHINITGLAGKSVPAFVVFSLNGGGDIQSHNLALTDPSVLNAAVAWDNELGVTLQQCRFVSLETHGTIIVTVGPSSQFPGQQAFFLKSTFGAGSAGPAVELLVNLVPSDQYTLDLVDFHVVETHNRVLLFYYTVLDEVGDGSTAHLAYTPVHSGFTDEIPFSTEGVVRKPRVIATDVTPIRAPKGARRHPVTHEIIVGLQPTGEPIGNEVQWYLTRGYGDVLTNPPDVWNAEAHPYLYGGRLKEAAPTREVSILSVGWADPRQGGIFPVTATLKIGPVEPNSIDFLNTYRTDDGLNRDQLRLCLGNLYAPRAPKDSNPGGFQEIVGGFTAPMEHNETSRVGYNVFYDFLGATNILQLDDIQQAGLTIAQLGGNGTVTGGITPTQGIVKGALYFYDELARIEIPGTQQMNGASVAVSCWVFPEQSGRAGDADQFTIASRRGGDDDVWRLSWREDTQAFQWRVFTTPGGDRTVDSTSLGPLPEKHWYHVTGVFDENTLEMRLFVNGFIVADDDYPPGSTLAYSPAEDLSIFLGDDVDGAVRSSFQGRLDDFVHGTSDEMESQRVVAAFHYGLLGPDGPMRVSRTTNDPILQDKIVATAMHEAAQPGSGVYYTFALRKVALTPVEPIRHQAVIDVWRNNRSPGGGGPQYMGMLPPPWWTLDQRTAYPTDGMRGHTIEDPRESYELKVTPTSLQTPGFLGVYFVLREHLTTEPDRCQIIRGFCDPDFPASQAPYIASYNLVAQLDSGPRITSFDAVLRGDIVSDEAVVIAAAYDIGTFPIGATVSNIMYIFRQQDWGVSAFSTSNKSDVTTLMPPATTGGSFEARNYNTAYTTEPVGPVIRGLIARNVVPTSGWPTLVHEGIQVIFGVQSFAGGTVIPADAPQDQIVSNLHLIIPPEAVDVLSVGDFPLMTDGESRQIDEYEQGGLDPFIPLRFIEHPESRSTGDVLIIGRSGNRSQASGREGNGGLALYRVKAQGNWSLRIVSMVGFDWGPSETPTVGASACLSTRESDDEPPVVVHVSRLHPDRSDKYSTIYVSGEEATSGGWTPESVLEVTPVLRRNDRVATIVWFNYKITTRAFTDERTGPKIVVGDKYKYAVNLRWSLPGSTQDPT